MVSFGLDGNEATSPLASAFAYAFQVAKNGGLLATPHAGELRGSESVAVDEYEIAQTELGLSDVELSDIAAASFQSSGAPDEGKSRALREIESWRTPAMTND